MKIWKRQTERKGEAKGKKLRIGAEEVERVDEERKKATEKERRRTTRTTAAPITAALPATTAASPPTTATAPPTTATTTTTTIIGVDLRIVGVRVSYERLRAPQVFLKNIFFYCNFILFMVQSYYRKIQGSDPFDFAQDKLSHFT